MRLLVDTGIWYAFCDLRERIDEREAVEDLMAGLEFAQVLLPWPIVYETLRTRLRRNQPALQRLEALLRGANIVFLDDTSYREDALRLVFESSLRKRVPRPLSLVDCLLRLMLEDTDLKIDRFATYNERDFRDVCARRTIEIVR